MRASRLRALALIALATVGCDDSLAARPEAVRKPAGIYALVNVRTYLGADGALSPRLAPVLASLLDNPAMSGLAVEVGWNTLNPASPDASQPYDWTVLDLIFDSADTWNDANASAATKTVALIVQPGFSTPAWALAQIPPSCNGLFQNPPASPSGICGQATFLNSEGSANPELQPLPLPWDSTYQLLWKTFLQALAARYGQNPIFVSIAVDGPTATSAEIIVPLQNLPSPLSKPSSGPMLPANMAGQSQAGMWSTLISSRYSNPLHWSDPAYQNSDQAFVEAWEAAIDVYDEVFTAMTFTISTGDQLPNFLGPHLEMSPPSAFFAQDCTANDNMDCAAESTIVSYFVRPILGGLNGQATMTSGLNSSAAVLDMGIDGAKLLAADTNLMPQVLGGAEFATSFSVHPSTQGCAISRRVPYAPKLSACEGLTPEMALEGTLKSFFNGTPAGEAFGGANGAASMNYLYIYANDILYASTNPATQAELNQASEQLLGMAKQ